MELVSIFGLKITVDGSFQIPCTSYLECDIGRSCGLDFEVCSMDVEVFAKEVIDRFSKVLMNVSTICSCSDGERHYFPGWRNGLRLRNSHFILDGWSLKYKRRKLTLTRYSFSAQPRKRGENRLEPRTVVLHMVRIALIYVKSPHLSRRFVLDSAAWSFSYAEICHSR
jgi:hypothetical protein